MKRPLCWAPSGMFTMGFLPPALILPGCCSSLFAAKKNALEILDLLKKGKMIKAMSLDLNVSESKIKRIIRGVYDKLQVNSRSEAIVVYLNNI